jgi:hypothetical protein
MFPSLLLRAAIIGSFFRLVIFSTPPLVSLPILPNLPRYDKHDMCHGWHVLIKSGNQARVPGMICGVIGTRCMVFHAGNSRRLQKSFFNEPVKMILKIYV